MTVATYPSTLPVPLREGYGYELPELGLRTDFAYGNRTRPLYTDGPDTFRVTALFSPAQCEFFKGWLRFAAANGANPVSLPLLVGGAVTSIEAEIIAPPSFALEGVNHWRMSLPLQTREGTTMSAEVFESISAFPDPATAWLDLQALENFVNG